MWTVSAFAIVVFGSSVVALGVGVGVLRKRPDPMAGAIAVLLFAVAAWAIPHSISLGYADVERVAFWHRLRYPGTVLAPVAYLVVALRYAEYEQWLTRRSYALLAIVPVLTVAAVWTNPYHGLFWRSLSVATVGNATVLIEEYGLWYWVNLGYLYLVTVAGLSLFGDVMVRSSPAYRKQSGLMFLGALAPLATNVAMTAGVGPEPMVDLTTTALAVTGVTFALALFHLDLLELRPIARDRLVENLDDGVVVVGPDGRIRDFNPAAARILGDVALDRSGDEVLPSDVAADGGELVAETANGRRRFRTRSSTLNDERGREIGRIVYLNDVTAVVEREQRISVLNRVLRHNIRNELNVVSAHLEMLEERVPEAEREHVERATEGTRRVVELAEKARHVEETFRESDSMETAPAAAIAERVVTDARETYPHAAIEYEVTDGAREAPVRVVDEELLEMAIAELVENAVEHNDRESPRVTVRVDPDGDLTRVSVRDDGPGIPERERAVLSARRETQLHHGSGLGLWLVTWTVSLSSARLSLEENEPRGTVATLAFASADG